MSGKKLSIYRKGSTVMPYRSLSLQETESIRFGLGMALERGTRVIKGGVRFTELHERYLCRHVLTELRTLRKAAPVVGFPRRFYKTVLVGLQHLEYTSPLSGPKIDALIAEGKRRGKQERVPDITLMLLDVDHIDDDHWVLHVEGCAVDKKGDRATSGANSKYGHHVKRFTQGLYSAAMDAGFILGFVRTGECAAKKRLSEYLPKVEEARYLKGNGLKSPMAMQLSCFESHHDREWHYPSSRTSPGPIRLDHLWVQLRDPPETAFSSSDE